MAENFIINIIYLIVRLVDGCLVLLVCKVRRFYFYENCTNGENEVGKSGYAFGAIR